MSLIYRGQPYTRSNQVKPVIPQTVFTYRGQSYQRNSSVVSVTPKAKLTYRGIPYIYAEASPLGNLKPTFS